MIRPGRFRYEVDGPEASHAVQYVDAVYFAVCAAILTVGTVCCCRPPLLLSVYTAGVDCDVSNDGNLALGRLQFVARPLCGTAAAVVRQVCTLTSIGFGDIIPFMIYEKIVAMIYMFAAAVFFS